MGSSNQATPQKTKTLLWGATGEQEWEPAIVTGKHKCSKLITHESRLI